MKSDGVSQVGTGGGENVHVVIGAGQIGLPLAEALVRSGKLVRVVRRGPPLRATAGLEWWRGNICDRDFAEEVCRGAAVVYNCTNPDRYDLWDGVLERLNTAIMIAAARAEARLVVLDNLYMYGVPPEDGLRATTPINPCSRKGELRAMLADELFEAHRAGLVRVTSGRASDYFGPACPQTTIFRPAQLARVANRGSVLLLGDPTLPRSYSYVGDVVEGLVHLGASERALGRPWLLPVTKAGSTLDLLIALAEAARTPVSHRVVPAWALTGLAALSPQIAAVKEMVYQWQVPFVVDDSEFVDEFGYRSTPVRVAARWTMAPYVRAERKPLTAGAWNAR